MVIKLVELEVVLADYVQGLGLQLAVGGVTKKMVPVYRRRIEKTEELLEELHRRRIKGVEEF